MDHLSRSGTPRQSRPVLLATTEAYTLALQRSASALALRLRVLECVEQRSCDEGVSLENLTLDRKQVHDGKDACSAEIGLFGGLEAGEEALDVRTSVEAGGKVGTW